METVPREEFGKEGGRLQVDKREEKEDSPIKHREEDKESGNSPQGVVGVELGKKGGGLQVDKREEKDSPVKHREEDEENGNSPRELNLVMKVADLRLKKGKIKKTHL